MCKMRIGAMFWHELPDRPCSHKHVVSMQWPKPLQLFGQRLVEVKLSAKPSYSSAPFVVN